MVDNKLLKKAKTLNSINLSKLRRKFMIIIIQVERLAGLTISKI